MAKDSEKYINILLADIQFHVTDPRKPKSAGRMMVKSLRNNKPGRFYKKGLSVTKDGRIQLPKFENKEIEELIKKAEKEGKKVRFFIPKKGLPKFLGNDTVECLKARYRKRI